MQIKKWKCPNCGKEIESLYEKQLEFNRAMHEIACSWKKKKKE